MPFVTVDGVDLHYQEAGAGEPLLFIHGLGSSGRDWARQARYYSDRYRVLRVDLRGHGRSERGQGPYSVPQFARDIAVFLRKLGAAPAHVVGLSMGGMIALELAAHPSRLVRSLVAVNNVADTRLHTWHDVWFYASRRLALQVLGLRWTAQILARKLFVKPDQADLRRKFVERWSQNDKQAYLWSVDAITRWSVTDRLDQMTAPTLFVSSDGVHAGRSQAASGQSDSGRGAGCGRRCSTRSSRRTTGGLPPRARWIPLPRRELISRAAASARCQSRAVVRTAGRVSSVHLGRARC